MDRDLIADLEMALEEADRRALAAVLVHLTGEPDLIIDGDDRENIKRLAREILPHFLEAGTSVAPPSDEALMAAMRLAADEVVPAEYGQFAREQMTIGPPQTIERVEGGAELSIAIIGAGAAGLAMAQYLDRAGLCNFTILEKNPQPGGTWWLNCYPGCRVDTPSLLYSYTFDPDPGWPKHFSYQPSLLEYMQATAAQFCDRLRTETAVESLVWEEDVQQWRVGVRLSDGTAEELWANVVVGALGFLSAARKPVIAGMESFEGPSFHSSGWDTSVSVDGKRVAIVGTGASANQIVPAIADAADEVLVYQRSPHWVMPHPYYKMPLTGAQRWLIERVPSYMAWFRFRQFWAYGDRLLPMMKVDPSWPDLPRSINAANEALRRQMTEYIGEQLAGREDLIPKVLPDFPPYAKRMIIDNGWYEAIRRSDVRLVTEPICEITPKGIRTETGEEAVDLIVYATGFYTNHVLSPIAITGRAGVDVRARLDAEPEAYLGIALQDCPNLFLMSGPNGVFVHGGAGTLLAEIQSTYIVECLRHMVGKGWAELEIRPSALREFVADAAAENAKYVWSTSGVTNWYAGSPAGGASVALPWTILKFWNEAKAPDLSHYTGIGPRIRNGACAVGVRSDDRDVTIYR
jgi:4-hydroxyacetophenone monooxygenase